MSSQKLTPREARFVEEYATLRNAKQAALNAGYSPKWPQMIGSRVLHKPHIVAALAARGVEAPTGPHPLTQARAPADRRRKTLSGRQLRFVQEYLVCGNATEAARRIGLGEKNAHANGARLMKRRFVAEAIAAEQAAAAVRTRITADEVRRELARIAFSDITAIADWDARGLTLRPIDAVPPDDRAAIAELQHRRTAKGTTRTRIRMHSKLKALDALARHLGLYLQPSAAAALSPEEEAASREKIERFWRAAKGEGE